MNPMWIPFLSAISGGVVTGAVALGGQWIQARSARHQDRLRLIVEASTQEHAIALEATKTQGGIPPLSAFIHYNALVLGLLDEGRLTPAALREINVVQADVNAMVREAWKRQQGGG